MFVHDVDGSIWNVNLIHDWVWHVNPAQVLSKRKVPFCIVTLLLDTIMYCFSTSGHCCVLFCDFWMLRQAKSVRRVLTWSTSSLVDTPWSWWHSWSSWSASWCIPEMFKYAFIISPIYNKKIPKGNFNLISVVRYLQGFGA